MKNFARLGAAAFGASVGFVAVSAPAYAWRRPLPVAFDAPIVADINPGGAYLPCGAGSPGCVYLAVSQARASCAIAAVSGQGLSSAQFIVALRAALARGCNTGPVVSTNLVSARF